MIQLMSVVEIEVINGGDCRGFRSRNCRNEVLFGGFIQSSFEACRTATSKHGMMSFMWEDDCYNLNS